ncbi:unnamed protein product, partial [Polarella glacialis]
ESHIAASSPERGEAAFALRGGGLTRVLTRQGSAELALAAVGRHFADQALVVHACAVVQYLAPSSREVKLLVLTPEAFKLWVRVQSKAELGDLSAAAVLRLLASLVTDDEDAKATAGGAEGFLQVLHQRLRPPK